MLLASHHSRCVLRAFLILRFWWVHYVTAHKLLGSQVFLSDLRVCVVATLHFRSRVARQPQKPLSVRLALAYLGVDGALHILAWMVTLALRGWPTKTECSSRRTSLSPHKIAKAHQHYASKNEGDAARRGNSWFHSYAASRQAKVKKVQQSESCGTMKSKSEGKSRSQSESTRSEPSTR